MKNKIDDILHAQTGPPLRAVIREAECIGCTKCIQACPVDAILGSAKWMHTVISDECTGCQLCIAPCPVDCIDMVPTNEIADDAKISHFENRFYAREKRLELERSGKQQQTIIANRKDYIQAAVARSKQKKPL